MGEDKDPKEIPPGTEINGYIIDKVTGKGAFGTTYSCKDKETGKKYAIKIEPNNAKKKTLKEEIKVIIDIKGSQFFPEFKEFGNTELGTYIVMELLGPSLMNLRLELRHHKFTPPTVNRLAIEMIRCIEQIHALGYIHRDIKPGNFLIRPNSDYPVVLIDFGLSRKITPTPREKPGFVGTSPYASLRAHRGLELGKCDDLMSWFYTLLRITRGKLPWAIGLSKVETKEAKQEADIGHFCRHLPVQYMEIYNYINDLKFEDQPNYAWIKEKLMEIDVDRTQPLDWELVKWKRIKCISAIPLANIEKKNDRKKQESNEGNSNVQNEEEKADGCTLTSCSGMQDEFYVKSVKLDVAELAPEQTGCTVGCLLI